MIYERKSRLSETKAASSESTAADCSEDSGGGVATWHRRHAAASRLNPLDCGCRDPWPCRCTVPPLSDKRIDAGRDAALHVLATGNVPLLEYEVLQALWRRGGKDRELAELLYTLTDGALA
ncbi:hypothetical protein MMAN_09540 [Mycobacterium mantenii]|uniref:Uncharacterized protein n=1 Tax=Mycobacterium mantenii TaxID=560555 RepID=A0A1X0G1T9_MYCNT|nr:hypothetical protein [Mycobacterium mantenii]MCV7244733.1 hypothetical protein [Mycobacterium mantenii]ORB07520.1 hypothetical protein BST30_06115 [Mycobacterium mantenii]BBY36820.1 hypothetical protein MMAN_09540 [Mycobacterium mantenii]